MANCQRIFDLKLFRLLDLSGMDSQLLTNPTLYEPGLGTKSDVSMLNVYGCKPYMHATRAK